MRRVARPGDRRRSRWSSPRRCWRSRRSRSSSTLAARSSTCARRVGRDGAEFELYKLRTMHTGNDPVGVGTPVLAGDPRVTRVGAFLRRFSLDELPNLVNVHPRRDVGRRTAPDARGAGRRLHAAPAPPARGQARAHRLGPGQRPRRDPLGRADRARRLVRRAPLAGARPADPRPHGPPAASPATASTGSVSAVPKAEVTLRDFRPGDAEAVHRWFNDERVTADLVGSRDSFTLEDAGGLGRAGDRHLRGPQVGDHDRRLRRRRRLRRPVRARPPARPRARGAGRRPVGVGQGRRPRGRAPGLQPGLLRARRAPHPRRDPGDQRGGPEGRHLPRLPLRGRDEGGDPARRRSGSTTRSGACCPRTSPGGTERHRGAARRRRRRRRRATTSSARAPSSRRRG